jgi:hypothetical protein
VQNRCTLFSLSDFNFFVVGLPFLEALTLGSRVAGTSVADLRAALNPTARCLILRARTRSPHPAPQPCPRQQSWWIRLLTPRHRLESMRLSQVLVQWLRILLLLLPNRPSSRRVPSDPPLSPAAPYPRPAPTRLPIPTPTNLISTSSRRPKAKVMWVCCRPTCSNRISDLSLCTPRPRAWGRPPLWPCRVWISKQVRVACSVCRL